MFEKNKEYIDELIAGFLSKESTSEQEEELLKWIESNVAHRKYYGQMYRAWLRSAQCVQLEPKCEELALQRVHKKAFELSVWERRQQAGKERSTYLPLIFKYAAAIALLVIGSAVMTRHSMMRQFESHSTGTTYEAHYGSRAYASLPDGSKVWLNAGSTLYVLPGYQLQERTVELQGEAYFEVVTNPQKPFIVKAGALSIKATGTSFNVKAYPEEGQITTTLVEGIVVIEGNDAQEKTFRVQLEPNQTVTYKKQTMIANSMAQDDTSAQPTKSETDRPQMPLTATTSQEKTETLTSWMKDRWIIDNEEFGNLAVQLERRYNVEIRFESDELKQYRFTGIIERETVEQMFNAFTYSIPLKYTIDRGIITLTPDAELEKQYEKAWKR